MTGLTDQSSATSDEQTRLPDLSVVIPALNEAENLKALLPLIQQVVTALNIKAEITVVDGGSIDDTKAVVAALNARMVLQTERGYGGALLAGFATAGAPYVATMDADLSHPPIFLKDFFPAQWDPKLGIHVT